MSRWLRIVNVPDMNYRACTNDDLAALYALYGVQSCEIYGGYAQRFEDFRGDMLLFGFDPTTDLFGAFTSEETMVGYAEFRIVRQPPVRPYLYGYTHPDYRGRGVGTRLIEMGLERARLVLSDTPVEARVVVQLFTPLDDGVVLLESIGAAETRQSYIMNILLDQPPPEPILPEGYRILTMADGTTLSDIAQAHQISFRDHRGSQDEPFEAVLARWEQIVQASSHFDPALYAVAKRGDENAAILIVLPTTEEDETIGEIDIVGVLPAHRRQGLGLALLHFAFRSLYKRGKRGAMLNVDGSSLTHATRLYERAGMEVTTVYHAFEYELCPGVEITRQG